MAPKTRQKNTLSNWQQIKIGNICDISAGWTPSTNVLEYWENGTVPWANSAEINKKNICSTENFITEAGLKRSSAKIVPINSVLIALAGQGSTRWKVAVNKIPLSTNQSVAFFVPREKINYSFLKSDLERRYQELRSISAGDGGRGGLNLQILKSLKILLPPLPEQNRIVAVLETWDRAIETLTKKIEIKKQIKKGLMQELLTGKTRLKGFSGKWETVELGDISEINPKYKNLPETFIYIDLESVEKGRLLKENEISLIGAPSRAQRLLKSGDILFQMVRPYQRNNLFFDKNWNYVASTGYAQIRVKNSSWYLYYLLHTDNFVNKVLDRCTGSSYPAINATDLSEIEIDVPKDPIEQNEIANILTTADTEITTLEKKLSLLKDQKKYLLNHLITGEIRTPEDLTLYS